MFCHAAFKGCASIVFTHGVLLGGQSKTREKSCSDSISESVTYRKFIHDGGHWLGGRMCATSWYDLDLTFGLVVVILAFNILLGYISEAIRCRNLIVGRYICQTV